MNSPNRKKIAEARRQAKERLNKKLQFPTEEDIGETKTNIYRSEFGEYEGARIIDIPHKYIEERRQIQKNGVKLGKESKRLIEEYTHLVEGNSEIYEEEKQETKEESRRRENGKEESRTLKKESKAQAKQEVRRGTEEKNLEKHPRQQMKERRKHRKK